MTRLIVVRHGRTAWNRDERFRGHADIALDQVGEGQAEACARFVASRFVPVAIYASPLKRTIQTAEAIGRWCGRVVQPHEGLLDMSFGEAEGVSWSDAEARWSGLVRAWRDAPHTATFPGGETLARLRSRLLAAVQGIAARHESEEIVLVGHDATNRVVLLAALGIGDERFWRIGQDPAAVSVLDLHDGTFTVVSMNDTCHLTSTIQQEEKRQ